MLKNAVLEEQAHIIAQAKQIYNEMKNAESLEEAQEILDRYKNIKTLLLGGSFKPKYGDRFELPLSLLINSFLLMIVFKEDQNALRLSCNESLCKWLVCEKNDTIQPPNLMQIKVILEWIIRLNPLDNGIIKAIGKNPLFIEALQEKHLNFNDTFALFNMLINRETINLAYALWCAREDLRSWYKGAPRENVFLEPSVILDLFIRLLETRHSDFISSFWQQNIILQLELLDNYLEIAKSITKQRSELAHPFFSTFINHIKDIHILERILKLVLDLKSESQRQILTKYQFNILFRIQQLNNTPVAQENSSLANLLPPLIAIEVLQRLASNLLNRQIDKTRRLVIQYPALMHYLTGNLILTFYSANAEPAPIQIKPDASVRYLNILIELEATDLIQMFWTLTSTQVKDYLIGGACDNITMPIEDVYKLYNTLVKVHCTEMANYVYEKHPNLSLHIAEKRLKARFPEVAQLFEERIEETCERDRSTQQESIATPVSEQRAFSQESMNESASTSFSTLYGYDYGYTIPPFPIQVSQPINENNLNERPEKRMRLNQLM